ncbi:MULTISPECIES: hypothetical protein [unclassified Anabaena]|uniref:hypothetical protein n=1 Tax=unclassified Anabaena TaxID=2619674 RepID=UPI000A79C8F3|nr:MULTISPECIES: hypothetical protein [unclassified Anabaena]
MKQIYQNLLQWMENIHVQTLQVACFFLPKTGQLDNNDGDGCNAHNNDATPTPLNIMSG